MGMWRLFWGDGNVLKLVSSDGCTTLTKILLNWIFTMGEFYSI